MPKMTPIQLEIFVSLTRRRLLGSESIISSVIISTSPASFILSESASSSPPSLSSVAAASRIGVDHFFRHHLHFSSVGVVHPRRVGVIISAVTQIRFCGNQRNPTPSAVKVLKEMLLRFTLAAKESDYFVVSKHLELEISLYNTMEVLCVCGQWRSKDAFHWEFHVDLNMNASFISIEEDLLFEDLMKIVSEDLKEEVMGLSYGMSLDIKSTVEGFPPISIANTRHLRSFIGKSSSFDGTCRLGVKVNADSPSCNNQDSDTFASPISTVQREIHVDTDSASCNRQTSDTFASHVPLNATPVFHSTVQRGKQCLLYEGVSTVPLNSLPDFSHVHIGLSPTTRGAGDIKTESLALWVKLARFNERELSSQRSPAGVTVEEVHSASVVSDPLSVFPLVIVTHVFVVHSFLVNLALIPIIGMVKSHDKNKKESDKVDRIVDEMGHQITKGCKTIKY
ncbi:hypothetical protein DY000_02029717 [Brassica cretica]|uniref:C2 NT-type domain-containing protein n=1 Tax=Brassica cretica TaxID=69181 RepID=A0ABQ7DFG6_BRACR|nr:hypothetical protein DY000_02029717 [Brassica cretica]